MCGEKTSDCFANRLSTCFLFHRRSRTNMKSTILNVTLLVTLLVFMDRKWNNLNENLETWCNILILHRFPVHTRSMHKWNTRLCMALGLCSTSFSIYCATQGVYNNGTSFYIQMFGVVEYYASQNFTLINANFD